MYKIVHVKNYYQQTHIILQNLVNIKKHLNNNKTFINCGEYHLSATDYVSCNSPSVLD